VVVDTLGLLIGVVVTEANASQQLGATVALLEERYKLAFRSKGGKDTYFNLK
jgi:hypothetical protein